MAKIESDPKKLVKIKLPRVKGGAPDLYVSVNDRNWRIQRGKEVEVPAYVAAVIENSIKQDEETAARIDDLVNTSNV